MQTTLNSLLEDIGKRHSELEAVTGEVRKEVTELGQVSDKLQNKFLQTITGLSKEMKRAEDLNTKLGQTTEANAELNREMLELTRRMERVLDEM
jgi:predicted  nucleic acid-binding Zn-ribbon protein